MFKSVHHALSFAYKTIEKPIMPIGNTASVVKFMEEKGVVGRGGAANLSQHDLHAQAVMLIKMVEDVLKNKPWILASIQCKYGAGSKHYHKGLMKLEQYYRKALRRGDNGEFGYMLHHIFTSTPDYETLKASFVLDGLRMKKDSFYRYKKKIREEINSWVDDGMEDLEEIFSENGIIIKEVA